MTMDLKAFRHLVNHKLTWLAGPAVVLIGLAAWAMLPLPSIAESQPAPVPSPAVVSAQNASLFNPAVTPTEATQAAPTQDTAPAEIAPVDGLKISSQSWRRGGLGSKALVTLTLRNRNEYAVKDIEIFCAFARPDGRHLTDRRRVIHETVNTRSQRTFAGMLVGFVNIGANQAKCSPVAASRI